MGCLDDIAAHVILCFFFVCLSKMCPETHHYTTQLLSQATTAASATPNNTTPTTIALSFKLTEEIKSEEPILELELATQFAQQPFFQEDYQQMPPSTRG